MNWNDIYKRFVGWTDKGVWRQMQESFMDDPDMEFILTDSAVARGAPLGGGSAEKKGAVVPSPRKKQRGLAQMSARRSISAADRCE